MRRRDRQRLAQSQLVELRGDPFAQHPFGLVHREQVLAPALAHELGDGPVFGVQAFASVNDEHDDVGLVHRLPRLLGHRRHDSGLGLRLEASRVDDEIRTPRAATVAVMAVAREPRIVENDRVTRASEAIEQRRLTDVGATDENDDRDHCLLRTVTAGIHCATTE